MTSFGSMGMLSVLAEAAGHGDDLEQVLAADELVAPGLLDRPDDGHLLVLVFLDEDGHLGVLDVLGLEQARELLDDPVLGQALDDDAPEERQGDRPVLRDADGLAELVDFEDLELEQVPRPDAVGPDENVLGLLGLGGRLRFSLGRGLCARRGDGQPGGQGESQHQRKSSHINLIQG
jgi:hypothetical protein